MLWDARKKPKGRTSSRPFLPRIPFLCGTNLSLGIVMTKLTEVTDDFAVTLQMTFLPWVLLHKQFWSCEGRREMDCQRFLCRGGNNYCKIQLFFPLLCIYLAFLLVQDVCCDLKKAGREKIGSECGQQPLEHFDVCQASLPSSRWKSCFAPWGRWRRIMECRCYTLVWHSLCLISGHSLFHEQDWGCVVGIKPNPFGLALLALWAWSIPVLGNIFLLASILDVKPKATFSIVCKKTHVGLCKEMVWKQLAHPNCPQSCGTAAGLELFFLVCFTISQCWSREDLELWVIFSASFFELPENVLWKGSGKSGWLCCCFDKPWSAARCKNSSLADLLFLYHRPLEVL